MFGGGANPCFSCILRLCECHLSLSAGKKSQGRQSHLGLEVGFNCATSNTLLELPGSGGRDGQDWPFLGYSQHKGLNLLLEGPVHPLCASLGPWEQRSHASGGCQGLRHCRAAAPVPAEMGFERKLREETTPCYFYPCTSPRGFRLTGLVMKPIL